MCEKQIIVPNTSILYCSERYSEPWSPSSTIATPPLFLTLFQVSSPRQSMASNLPGYHLSFTKELRILIQLSGSLLKRLLRVMMTHLRRLEPQPQYPILDVSSFLRGRPLASSAPGSRSLSIAQAPKHPIFSANSIALVRA
jgi:hypothetical protein